MHHEKHSEGKVNMYSHSSESMPDFFRFTLSIKYWLTNYARKHLKLPRGRRLKKHIRLLKCVVDIYKLFLRYSQQSLRLKKHTRLHKLWFLLQRSATKLGKMLAFDIRFCEKWRMQEDWMKDQKIEGRWQYVSIDNEPNIQKIREVWKGYWNGFCA